MIKSIVLYEFCLILSVSCFYCFFPSHRSEVKARQDVKPDFRHPPFTDYRQPPVDYRHPPVTDYRQPPTLDYRQPPSLLDFRQHPAAAQFPLGIPADFRPQVWRPVLISYRHRGNTSLRALDFSEVIHDFSTGLWLLHGGVGEKLKRIRLQYPRGQRVQDGPVCVAPCRGWSCNS